MDSIPLTQLIEPVQPEAPVSCCSSSSGSSRRHGRFLVQPLMETNSTTSIRAPSPASGKPPLGPPNSAIKLQQSPQPSYISERRPSRIIGRFEVSELFPADEAGTPLIAFQRSKSVDLDTCPSSTPIQDKHNFSSSGI